ncbi:MAG: hypothetical protein OXR66_07155 [Candidatus Woesearchaeota archaeon]|nr:hypothetical protein [Candidatus Woesearchaeota archaeon]
MGERNATTVAALREATALLETIASESKSAPDIRPDTVFAVYELLYTDHPHDLPADVAATLSELETVLDNRGETPYPGLKRDAEVRQALASEFLPYIWKARALLAESGQPRDHEKGGNYTALQKELAQLRTDYEAATSARDAAEARAGTLQTRSKAQEAELTVLRERARNYQGNGSKVPPTTKPSKVTHYALPENAVSAIFASELRSKALIPIFAGSIGRSPSDVLPLLQGEREMDARQYQAFLKAAETTNIELPEGMPRLKATQPAQ